ncbi:MAG: hypothetical protein ACI4DX_07810 [Oliverpabstia sp.]|nr:hypothetical protein [Eubacterium sp.]MDY2594568.1 hypothetical protein [Oliverpabstia sp.]
MYNKNGRLFIQAYNNQLAWHRRFVPAKRFLFPGVCCSVSSRLEQIDIAGIRINTCQDRIPTLEDFIIGTLPDTGKVNRFIKFCCTCGCLIQDLADLTDGNMFLKIIFKDPALHGMI